MEITIISICCSVLCCAICVLLLLKINKLKSVNGGDAVEKLYSQIEQNEITQTKLQNSLNELLLQSIKASNETIVNTVSSQNQVQMQHLSEVISRLNNASELQAKNMQNAIIVVENGLNRLQKDNEQKLEQMRQTVDEKLNSSLENRLTQSFNIINERLQSVYEGIGVMKQLANGVGDLKKVLTNVKTRGVWGEVQLGNLLEQILTKSQYASQVLINEKNLDRVDFVVNMPGKDENTLYLPIDAKFPLEDYERLIEASENGSKQEIETAVKNIEKRVKDEAKKISSKYICIPKTTDFAILYLPIEGLYAEVLRIPGLVDTLQQQYKIVVCGPTTLSALLNSLQLGFKSLEVEKRSSEVWGLLSVFKAEFVKFVELLSKTQKKLNEASNTIEFATKKSKTIERKLKNVSSLTQDNIQIENEFEEIGEESEED